jgi:hypothetical protein
LVITELIDLVFQVVMAVLEQLDYQLEHLLDLQHDEMVEDHRLQHQRQTSEMHKLVHEATDELEAYDEEVRHQTLIHDYEGHQQ